MTYDVNKGARSSNDLPSGIGVTEERVEPMSAPRKNILNLRMKHTINRINLPNLLKHIHGGFRHATNRQNVADRTEQIPGGEHMGGSTPC